MKTIYILLICLLGSAVLSAQTITYCIGNGQTVGTNYEFDVKVKSSVNGTLLGDGIFYVNYNMATFGTAIYNSVGFTIDRDANGAILGTKVASIIYVYSSSGLLGNNNSDERFAVAWEVEQASFAAALADTFKLLCHVTMPIATSAVTPSVSFHEPLMEDETYESTNTTTLTVAVGGGCSTTPFPVEGLALTADVIDELSVQVDWITLKEINTDYFFVEKKSDTGVFSVIGKVGAKGNTDKASQYKFIDQSTMSPVMYYRVRQVDINGHYTYSNTAEVHMDEAPWIQVYPVPTSGQLFVSFTIPKGTAAQFRLYDLTGKLVYQFSEREGFGIKKSIDLSHMPEGIYTYRAVAGEVVTSGKVVKITE